MEIGQLVYIKWWTTGYDGVSYGSAGFIKSECDKTDHYEVETFFYYKRYVNGEEVNCVTKQILPFHIDELVKIENYKYCYEN